MSILYYHASNIIQHFPSILTLSNQHIGAVIPLNQLCCWPWTISTMLLMKAHRRCWYHWILALHLTPLTTLFSSVAHKPASAYLDSPLHGSTPILRGAVNVHIGCSTSTVTLCTTVVPQESLLGPMLFSLFISPISHIVRSYGLLQQQYADDTQLYVTISKEKNYDTPVAKLELCLSTLHTWFCYNQLALSPDKSEAIVFGNTKRSRSLPICQFRRNPCPDSNQVRILGVTLDSRLSIDAHISELSKSYFYQIRALRHLRPNLTLDCSKNIACSLVGCRFDYANSTLVGILIKNVSRL